MLGLDVFFYYEFVRSMTIFAEANVDVDLRMLRSFRVLRPLKLVSRIPSKGHFSTPIDNTKQTVVARTTYMLD